MPEATETVQPNPAPPVAEAKPTAPPAHKRLTLPGTSASFVQQGFAVSIFDAFIPVDHTLEDILESTYWLHHANKVKLYSIIRAYHLGGEFDLDLRVLDCSSNFVKVRIRGGGTYDKETAKAGLRADPRSLFKVRHIPGKRYVVQHTETGRIESENHATRDEADAALDRILEKLR